MNVKTTHIFLAGGGNADDSKPIDVYFVRLLDHTKPLIYIPNAMRSRPYQSCLEWFRSVMNPLGVHTIEMWDDLYPHRLATDVAGMYIGGGDTMKLIGELRGAGFDNYLCEIVQSGTPLYGGSAGAIILGENIQTDPEIKDKYLSETAGLKIINDYSIVCHYTAENQQEIQALSKTLRQHIIAIPEKAGGYISGRVLTNYGTEPLTIFQNRKIIHIDPNHSTKLQTQRKR